jgi:hypothetical protein
MEEFITTVIVLAFNCALDVRDMVTRQSQVATYVEVDKNTTTGEVRLLAHDHLHSAQKGRLTGKRSRGA